MMHSNQRGPQFPLLSLKNNNAVVHYLSLTPLPEFNGLRLPNIVHKFNFVMIGCDKVYLLYNTHSFG